MPQESSYPRGMRVTWFWVVAMNTMKQDHENRTGRSRRRFDDTFKQQAVELSLKGGRTVAKVAEELGITDSLLHAWRRQFAPRPGSTTGVSGVLTAEQKDEEIVRLRAEVIRLREREVVLKKSLGILSETPESGMPKWKK